MLTAICAHSDNQARGKDALHLGLLIVHSSPQRPYGDPQLGNLDGGRNKNNRPQSLREIPHCLPYPTQSLTQHWCTGKDNTKKSGCSVRIRLMADDWQGTGQRQARLSASGRVMFQVAPKPPPLSFVFHAWLRGG